MTRNPRDQGGTVSKREAARRLKLPLQGVDHLVRARLLEQVEGGHITLRSLDSANDTEGKKRSMNKPEDSLTQGWTPEDQTPVREEIENAFRKVRGPEDPREMTAARSGYQAGWEEAETVAREGPDTHPSDRRHTIPQARWNKVSRKVGRRYGPKGPSKDAERAIRTHVMNGYRDQVLHQEGAALDRYMSENPEQATVQSLRTRMNVLWSRDAEVPEGMDHLPRGYPGRRRQMKLLDPLISRF